MDPSITNVPELLGLEIKTPSDSDWERYSSTYNLRVPITPKLVALPTCVGQVSQAVRWAAGCGLKIQARSGGHSYASHSNGGVDGSVVVDLRKLQDVELSQGGIVRVGGGVRLGNLASAILRDGRALAHGTCPAVRIGGHFTHGGFGFASRAWGLSMDQIVRLDVVLADGRVVRASESENKDLYMAMRGAADSFGIIVNFYLLTQEEPKAVIKWSVDVAAAMKSVKSAVETFAYIQDFVNNATVMDRHLGIVIFLAHDRFTIEGTYLGDSTKFHDKIFMPLRQGFPVAEAIHTSYQSVDWLALLRLWAGDSDLEVGPNYEENLIFFAKSAVVSHPGLSRDELEGYFMFLLAEGPSTPVDYFVGVQLYGGADSQITTHAAPDSYGHRDAMWVFQHYGSVRKGEFPDEGIRFIDHLNKALGPEHGASSNYADPSLQRDEAHKLYYGEKLAGLAKLKGVLDPRDVFSHPQSIRRE